MGKKILVNSIWEDILLIFALEWWISQIAKFEDKCYEAVVAYAFFNYLPLVFQNQDFDFEGLYWHIYVFNQAKIS